MPPPPGPPCLTAIDGAQQLLAGTPVATTRWIKDAKGSIMGHQDIHTYMQVCMLKIMEAFKGIWLTDSTWTYKKKLWSWTSFFLWTANFSHFSLLSFRDTLSRSTWFNVFLRKKPMATNLTPLKTNMEQTNGGLVQMIFLFISGWSDQLQNASWLGFFLNPPAGISS